ncbi:MAG: transposase [Proteobacteria bacterium]|nr:transposase [Pseudomonadota bacterium]
MGCPWRDLPSEFGAWDAVYNRFRRWEFNGWLRTFFALLAPDQLNGDIKRVFIDSSLVRVHQHATGARRKKSDSRRRRRNRVRALAGRGAA